MAGRKDKTIVDYFPHQCEHGKTMYILESKFPRDGYRVWFKTLELLGRAENHYLDCRDIDQWEYILAYTKMTSEELTPIYDTLARLNSIQPDLWEKKIIWSGNFVSGIESVYKKRNNTCMYFDDINFISGAGITKKYNRYGISDNGNLISGDGNSISGDENTQSKVKESKGNKKEEKEEKKSHKELPDEKALREAQERINNSGHTLEEINAMEKDREKNQEDFNKKLMSGELD